MFKVWTLKETQPKWYKSMLCISKMTLNILLLLINVLLSLMDLLSDACVFNAQSLNTGTYYFLMVWSKHGIIPSHALLIRKMNIF